MVSLLLFDSLPPSALCPVIFRLLSLTHCLALSSADPTGLNLAGRRPVPTIYTTDQLPIRYISVFVLDDENTTRSIKSANSICKVNGDQFTTQGTLFFERRATGEDNCSTFHYTDQTLIVEGCLTLTNNDKKVNEDFGDRGTIEVAAVPGDCNNTELLALATRITISRK